MRISLRKLMQTPPETAVNLSKFKAYKYKTVQAEVEALLKPLEKIAEVAKTKLCTPIKQCAECLVTAYLCARV